MMTVPSSLIALVLFDDLPSSSRDEAENEGLSDRERGGDPMTLPNPPDEEVLESFDAPRAI
jgi:hypothetical protein